MSQSAEQSYYTQTARVFAGLPPPRGEVHCDACVIGGGLTGITAALALAERGFEVVLLEANTVGWGASGRSGGQVIFGYACEMAKLERLTSPEDARRLWDMSLEAVRRVKARIDRHAIDCDWRDGQLHVAIKPRHEEELRGWQALLAERYGCTRLQWLERAALATQVQSPRYRAGLYDPESGHLHPLNYTVGMAHAARAAGVRIHERARVLRLSRGAKPVVHLAHGAVHARQVVVAGNAWLGPLVPELEARLMPVGTYIVSTPPLGEELAHSLLPGDAAVTDINFVLDYFRRSADHRLLFGGRVSYTGLTPPRLAASMQRRMATVFPQLEGVPVESAWGGFVDITMNRAPHFGRLDGNLYFAQGFCGHGMALTGLAGEVIAEAIAGDAERLDVFARIPHRVFPGGRLLRVPGLLLATAWYRLRDLL